MFPFFFRMYLVCIQRQYNKKRNSVSVRRGVGCEPKRCCCICAVHGMDGWMDQAATFYFFNQAESSSSCVQNIII